MPSRVAPPASLSAVRRPIKEVTHEAERFVREGSPVLQLQPRRLNGAQLAEI